MLTDSIIGRTFSQLLLSLGKSKVIHRLFDRRESVPPSPVLLNGQLLVLILSIRIIGVIVIAFGTSMDSYQIPLVYPFIPSILGFIYAFSSRNYTYVCIHSVNIKPDVTTRSFISPHICICCCQLTPICLALLFMS